MSDWWSRHLGGPVAPAPQQYQQPGWPPIAPPAPQHQQAPQYAPQQPQEAYEEPGTTASTTQGGPALKANEGRCPSCNSPNLFLRKGGTLVNQHGQACSPAPQCYDCSWNGVYDLSADDTKHYSDGEQAVRSVGVPMWQGANAGITQHVDTVG